MIITAFIAWGYHRYGALPEVQPFIYGIKPAIIAIIVALMFSLGRRALKTTVLAVMAATAFLLACSALAATPVFAQAPVLQKHFVTWGVDLSTRVLPAVEATIRHP